MYVSILYIPGYGESSNGTLNDWIVETVRLGKRVRPDRKVRLGTKSRSGSVSCFVWVSLGGRCGESSWEDPLPRPARLARSADVLPCWLCCHASAVRPRPARLARPAPPCHLRPSSTEKGGRGAIGIGIRPHDLPPGSTLKGITGRQAHVYARYTLQASLI